MINQNRIDSQLFLAFAGLTIFGLVMMSSVSISESFQRTGSNDYFFWRHFRSIVISIPVFLVALKFPYHWLRKLSIFSYILGIAGLIFVLFYGTTNNTFARSWINLGFISVQPVELAKVSVIIFLSAVFSSGKYVAKSFWWGLVPFGVIVALPAALIIAQPDLGSLFVLLVAASAIYFAAGADWRHIIYGGLLGLLVVVGTTLTVPYVQRRVAVFLDPSLDPLNTGFQVQQALIAIGSGGVFGRGFQASIQKFDYLPEVQSDTIFAIIAEELGLLGVMGLIGVYLFIGWRGYAIALAAPDAFTRLLAVGMTSWIVGQAFINIAVNLALLPNTGITLPFISFGGSSMLFTFAACGVLLHVSGHLAEQRRRGGVIRSRK